MTEPAPGERPPSPFIAGIGVAVAVGLGLRFAFLEYTDYVSEDAFITFRYVRNLSAGLGFVYNAGEPVLGTTTPLFTLLLWLCTEIGLSAHSAAVGIGMLADAVSIGLVGLFLRLLGRSTPVSVAAAIVYATSSSAVIWSVSGMETALYTAFVLGAVTAFAGNRHSPAAVLSALAALTRPEAAALSAILVALTWFQNPRAAVRMAALIALTAGPWVLWAWVEFGSPIPLSVRAKATLYGGTNLAGRIFDNLWRVVGSGTWTADLWASGWAQAANLLTWLWLVLGAAGLVGSVRDRRRLALTAFAAISFALYSTSSLKFPWYWSPLVMVASIAAMDGAAMLTSYARASRWTRGVPIASCAALLLINSVSMAGAFQLYAAHRYRDRVTWEAAGRWLAKSAPPEASICLEHIGYVGYFSNRRVVDTSGLISPSVVELNRVLPRAEPMRRIRVLQAHVDECDFFLTTDRVRARIDELAPQADQIWLRRNFRTVQLFADDPRIPRDPPIRRRAIPGWLKLRVFIMEKQTAGTNREPSRIDASPASPSRG